MNKTIRIEGGFEDCYTLKDIVYLAEELCNKYGNAEVCLTSQGTENHVFTYLTYEENNVP